MDVIRPRSYIAYGPVGSVRARLMFDTEAFTRAEAETKLAQVLRSLNQNSCPKGTATFHQGSPEAEGYFVVEINAEKVYDAEIQALPVPPMFRRPAAGEPGRKLEHFPHTIAGYFQHYNYQVIQEGSRDCDHDFGLDQVDYVVKTGKDQSWIPLSLFNKSTREAGDALYLRTTCTRCGSVQGIKQTTVHGEMELF